MKYKVYDSHAKKGRENYELDVTGSIGSYCRKISQTICLYQNFYYILK